VLMTVTGTLGGLCFAAWAGADRLWSITRRARFRPARAQTPRSREGARTSDRARR
jgi:hypothetical protein